MYIIYIHISAIEVGNDEKSSSIYLLISIYGCNTQKKESYLDKAGYGWVNWVYDSVYYFFT